MHVEVRLPLDSVTYYIPNECARHSSNICKLSALGLGWEVAFGQVDEMGKVDDDQKRWVEIDQKGRIVPVWVPFELF